MSPSRSREANLSQIAIFSFRTGSNCARGCCSDCAMRKKRAGHEGPAAKSSPSRERFRPPSRRTFRFRVVLLGGLRPTGAPCSAQAEIYGKGPVRSRGSGEEFCRSLRTNCGRYQPIQPWPFQYARSLPRRESSRWSSSGWTSPGVAKTWNPSAAWTSSNSRSGRLGRALEDERATRGSSRCAPAQR